jgi:hypothetical protein
VLEVGATEDVAGLLEFGCEVGLIDDEFERLNDG